MKTANRNSAKIRFSAGSALILVVVLTSLLAIIGVMFIMVARVDKISTSAIIENKELVLAVETVIAKISQELVLDVPDPNQEYYDYPDSANRWLASLEPEWHDNGTPAYLRDDWYTWRQITDLYANNFGLPLPLTQPYFDPDSTATTNSDQWDSRRSTKYLVWAYDVVARTVGDTEDTGYTIIDRGNWNNAADLWPVGRRADADGDGVADSRWIQLPDMTSSRGKPIFAAIRVIDNSAMLNVNTAYKFDPTEADGSSQMQINLMALSWRPGTTIYNTAEETDLLRARANYGVGVNPFDLRSYEQNVVWLYGVPNRPYTPFDISDELELRYRFLLNHSDIDTRLENWGGELRRDTVLSTPVETDGQELDKWHKRAHFVPSILDPLIEPDDPNYYAYRHIATTYNMDRIIDPSSNKMLNVNTAYHADVIYNKILAIRNADPNNFIVTDAEAAQMAVNIKDYSDGPDFPPTHPLYDPNNDVSNYTTLSGNTYYGFERPCIYISELAYWFTPNPLNRNEILKSYAIELYKPYFGDDDPVSWRLMIDGNPISITWPTGGQFHVIINQDDRAKLLDPPDVSDQQTSALVFDRDSFIQLQRRVIGEDYVTVDKQAIPTDLIEDAVAHTFQRDITLHKCIRRLWNVDSSPPDLHVTNSYVDTSRPELIQAHPGNRPFTNIGEIGMVFISRDPNAFGPSVTEASVRIDLANPVYQQMFKYLTVFDPASDGIDNDGDFSTDEFDELKIPGRININTAPWFVIAQLPWVSDKLAQAIVAYRDKFDLTSNGGGDYTLRTGLPGIGSIGELNNINLVSADPNYSIDYYGRDKDALNNDIDQPGFPDLTPGTGIDGVANDFEERDVIFARISNLVTVRSDVFTAYILVRIGTDGPQKRVIAILDRSDVYSPTDKVKIIALHSMADPR
ncbi:MAG: ComEA family DNA-binding protein [Planctomycetota bacterium]